MKNKTKKITKKWDDSPSETSFDDLNREESSENVTSDEEKRLGNERSKRSSAFMVALKNMKQFAQKASIIDRVSKTNIISGSTSVVADIMLSATQSAYVEN